MAVSGSLFTAEAVGNSTTYPALINIPGDVDPAFVLPGVVGTATVVPEGAGAIGTLASIILWMKAFVAYL